MKLLQKFLMEHIDKFIVNCILQGYYYHPKLLNYFFQSQWKHAFHMMQFQEDHKKQSLVLKYRSVQKLDDMMLNNYNEFLDNIIIK